MTGRLVLTARDIPNSLFGRRVEYVLAHEGASPHVVFRKRVLVPRVSPINAYAGKFVRLGLAEAQRLGVPFEDRTWTDLATGSIEVCEHRSPS